MVVHYRLGRERLAVVDIVEILLRGLEHAASVPPERAPSTFRGDLLTLLPAVARSGDPDRWLPFQGAPLDEWARVGAYRGAMAGRARMAPEPVSDVSPRGRVYGAAYSIAYPTCFAFEVGGAS